MRVVAMRAAVGIAASMALCALIIQVFESSGSTTELLRSRGIERLDTSAPKSPIQYWGLGGIGRARKWGPSPYRSIVTFRSHKGGKAHHAKLIHLKHNAELEREAAGFFPAPPSERDELPVSAKANLLRRHMEAGLFDKEDASAPMGTHFVISPDHPQYVRSEEVAAPTDQTRNEEEPGEAAGAKQPVRARSTQHDLSESVTPREAMGTHFISSPMRPEEQGRTGGARQETNGDATMGTHFITSPDHPAQQRESARRTQHDLSESVTPREAMGTHFISSPTRPEEQGRAGGARQETDGAASVSTHSSVSIRDAGGMGTHFISSPPHAEAQASKPEGPASLVFSPEEGAAAEGPAAVGAAMASSSSTTMTHEPRNAGALDDNEDAEQDGSAAMGTHFTHSPERAAAQGEASGVAVEEAAAPRGVAGAHVHSSDDEVAEFGTHFIGSKNVFVARGKTSDTHTAWAASSQKSAYSRALLLLE
jgi:hypothetical protein